MTSLVPSFTGVAIFVRCLFLPRLALLARMSRCLAGRSGTIPKHHTRAGAQVDSSMLRRTRTTSTSLPLAHTALRGAIQPTAHSCRGTASRRLARRTWWPLSIPTDTCRRTTCHGEVRCTTSLSSGDGVDTSQPRTQAPAAGSLSNGQGLYRPAIVSGRIRAVTHISRTTLFCSTACTG